MNCSPSVRILPAIQSWLPGDATTLCRDIKAHESGIDVEPIAYIRQSERELRKAEVLITNDISPEVLKRADSFE